MDATFAGAAGGADDGSLFLGLTHAPHRVRRGRSRLRLGSRGVRKDGYHLDDFNIYFEILDRDENGYGELVATTLARRTMPFIRYRVHDVTRFIEAPCLRRPSAAIGDSRAPRRNGSDGCGEYVPGNI